MEYVIEFIIGVAASSPEGGLVFMGGIFLVAGHISRGIGDGFKRRAKRKHLIADGSGRPEDRFMAEQESSWGRFYSIWMPLVMVAMWLFMAAIVFMGRIT